METGSTPASGEPEYWDGGVTWVTPEDLSAKDGQEIGTSARSITEAGYADSGTTLVPAGSIIVSTRAPIGYVALASVPLCFNQGCKALVPRGDEHPRYWLYALRSYADELRSWGRGSTYRELGTQQLKDVSVGRPAKTRQIAIANHLVAETARIDALIDRKQRFIDLLTEKRAALITHAVTKGLDPEVEMRESGVPWLGEVPAHWGITKFPRAIDLREGPGILSPDFRDSGIPLLKIGNLTGDAVTMEGCYYLDPADVVAKWQRFVLAAGDLLISGSASLGGSTVVTDEAVGAVPYTGVIRLRPIAEKMDRRYARYMLWSRPLVEQVRQQSAGVAIKHFGPSHLSRVWVPLPPLAEQAAIAAHLDAATAHLDALLAKTRHSIDLLRELRTSLISAAVTGQLDIPTDQEPPA